MPGNDTNVSACTPPTHLLSTHLPQPPSSSFTSLLPVENKTQQSSDQAAGYLAKHTKLILVLLKPDDYGGGRFPLCLFEYLIINM